MLVRRAAPAILRRPRLAGAAVVLVAGVLGLTVRYAAQPPADAGVFGGPTPPPAVAALLLSLFSEQNCHDPAGSQQAVRQALAAAGLAGWSVRIGSQVKPTDCVTATYDVGHQQVVLLLAMRPEIKRAIDGVIDELLKDCLDRDHAETLLRNALTAAGASDFEVRTDGGEAGPIEREAEIHAHFVAGCSIYSASGWRADGTPIYVIGGQH